MCVSYISEAIHLFICSCVVVVLVQKGQYETCVARAVQIHVHVLLLEATKQRACTSHPSIHIYTYLHTQSGYKNSLILYTSNHCVQHVFSPDALQEERLQYTGISQGKRH